jgi:hypothetical protein
VNHHALTIVPLNNATGPDAHASGYRPLDRNHNKTTAGASRDACPASG